MTSKLLRYSTIKVLSLRRPIYLDPDKLSNVSESTDIATPENSSYDSLYYRSYVHAYNKI